MRAKKGFTLVEILLALLLVTIGLFPLLIVISSALSSSGGTFTQSSALDLAQSKMEEIENTPFDNILSAAKNVLPDFPAYKQEVQVTNPQSNLKDVKVILYWYDQGVEKNLNLETLITK